MSRELDAKVAEKVMGWEIFRVGYEDTPEETPEQKKYAQQFIDAGFEDIGVYAWTGKEVVRWEHEWSYSFPFTSEASADYEVLKRVRETWLFSKRTAFWEFFEQIIFARANSLMGDTVDGSNNRRFKWPDAMLWYEPGDFSKAALKVIEEQTTA